MQSPDGDLFSTVPRHAVSPAIAELRERIAHLEGPEGRTRSVLPFGQTDIDRRLSGRELELGCVHEMAGGGRAVDGQDRCAHQGKVLWVVTRPDPFAPAIAQARVCARPSDPC